MTVLTPSNAFPGASFLQHGSGLTTTVQNYIYPGAVQPKSTTPTVLSYANAFPNAPFPQHGSGLTTTVQAFWFPGAVQPAVSSGPPAGNLFRRDRMTGIGVGGPFFSPPIG